MLTEVALELYNRFYQKAGGNENNIQSSAHWKNFSQNFKVESDEAGNIKEIKGYGFGGSDDDRLLAKITAFIGNTLIRSQLSYPGLDEAIRKAKRTVSKMGLSFSQDALRQACTAFFLKEQIGKQKSTVNNILIIGDGHGILSALMSEEFPEAKIFLIDLGQTLFFQAFYLGKTFPKKTHVLLNETTIEFSDKGFFYCPAEDLKSFPKEDFDLAINVASMQEMTMDVVDAYFEYLRKRKTKLFYCCNRLEKTLPDGKVIRFMDYPWKRADSHLIDEKCPWHQFFFGRSASENIKLGNLIPVPMLHRYDGIHWHRLSILSH